MKEEKKCAKLLYHVLCYCKLHEDCMVGIHVAAVTSGGRIALTMGGPSFPRICPGSQILGAANTRDGCAD